LNVKSGLLHVYCCFDVANLIELDNIKKILNKQPEESPIQLDKLSPTYMQYKEPPLLLQLGKKTILLGEIEVSAFVSAKIFSFGTVSIVFRIPVKGSMASLKKLAVEFGSSKAKFASEAKNYVKRLTDDMTPALVKPNPEQPNDVFSIFQVKEFDEKVSAQDFAKKNPDDVAVLLSFEAPDLSDRALLEVLRNSFSYYKTDFIACYSNSVFLIDETDAFDVLDVLEYGFIQAVELRMFDSRLDRELDGAYDDVEQSNKAGFFYNYEAVRNEVAQLRLDTSEVVEKVENALKLVGDAYLAKVYSLTSASLHLQEWKTSIQEKLNSLEHVYEVLDDKAQAKRDLKFWVLLTVLEVVVIILIAFEVFFPR